MSNWVATDNFDSYSSGASLDGASGGSGWSGNWTALFATTNTAETAPSGGQGGMCYRSNTSTGQSFLTRAFSAISSGTLRFRIRVTNTSPNDFVGVVIESGSSGVFYIRINGGNIQWFKGGVYTTIQAVSADTWYTVDIDFNDATQNNKYRVRVDEGSWTSWDSAAIAFTTVDTFRIDKSATTSMTLYVDDIKDADAVAASAAQVIWFS